MILLLLSKSVEFLIMVDILLIFLFELKIYYQGRVQKLILLTDWIFCL